QLVLIIVATVPDRTNRVNHMARGQPVAARHLGLTRATAAKRAALLHQLRASRAVNRAIDTTTAEQRAIGRVDDSIDVEEGNIPGDDKNALRHVLASLRV